MKIALIGYGKMGRAIEKIATERGHTITAKVNSQNPITTANLKEADIAIEFSRPDMVLQHINFCLNKDLPIVVGTTAWGEYLDEVKTKVENKQGGLLHASNFSVGVNIFFEINQRLAKLMNNQPEYSAKIEETHHVEKVDAPSGTAITIAEELMLANKNFQSWILGEEQEPFTNKKQIPLIAYRKPEVRGTHTVTYSSEIDDITISHKAHNRKGFALGAVIAAEFLLGKSGVFTMKDVLKNTL